MSSSSFITRGVSTNENVEYRVEYLTEKYIESDFRMQYETNIVDDGWLFKHTEKQEVEKLIHNRFNRILKNSCFVNESGIDKLSPISIIMIDNKTDQVIGHCTINPKMNATTQHTTSFLMKTAFLINNGILRGIALFFWYFFGCYCNWKVWKVHSIAAKIFLFCIESLERVFENTDYIILTSMAIHPNYQRKGFGTILMNQVINHINKYYNVHVVDNDKKDNNNTKIDSENENRKGKDKVPIMLASMTPKSKNFYIKKCGFDTLLQNDFYADTINKKVNIWLMMYDYNHAYVHDCDLKKQHNKDINTNTFTNGCVSYFKNQIVKQYQRIQLVDRRKTYAVGAVVSIVGALCLPRLLFSDVLSTIWHH